LTGTEILAMASTHTEGDTVDNTEGLKFINEWLLMDLGRDAGITDSEAITVVTADTWYALPADFIEETEILKDGQPYWGTFYGVRYAGTFDIRNGFIRFPYSGVFTVYHIRRPAAIAALTESPEVNEVFHYPGSLYVAYRYKYYDDEDSKDAQRLRGEYDYYKNKAILEFQKMNKSSTKAPSRVKARAWR